MRHFCCCPCRGLVWRALSCKCDAASTPPKVPGVRDCLRGQAENRGYYRAAAAASRVTPSPPPRQPNPSPRGIIQAVSVWGGGASTPGSG